MLKPLLYILVIVIILAVALNSNFFSNLADDKKIIIKTTQQVEVIPTSKDSLSIVKPTTKIVHEDNLSKELQELLYIAQTLFYKNKSTEALLVYEEIITKSKNSKDIKILKIFAKAYLDKATVHYMYPNNDIDSAIEIYELIINKFQNKYNKELLISYMKAKIQQAEFTSKDETLIAYDEVIEKFQNDKEKRFKKEIEELLFAKSFALMGVNDEEAIEVLDSIITKYEDKSNLPDTVKFSILNNIELSIITANDTDEYVDLANKYMSDSPDTKPLLAMLSIIKNAQELNQSEALLKWKEEHSKYTFPDWDFSELRKWVNTMETPEAQKRIRQYLDMFEKQKYNNVYQTSNATVPISPVYSDEVTQNNEPVYEEEAVYEPDPYLEEILSTQPELSYPNPYSTYEPSTQTGGVSHTYQPNP